MVLVYMGNYAKKKKYTIAQEKLKLKRHRDIKHTIYTKKKKYTIYGNKGYWTQTDIHSY